ncbi:MAG TPA: PrsW family intramembrane metalloprotease [Acidimicrobiia bacterium]|nr:PrsW family intramembrane metalloprotease [Acidimicrobiia bacterium]
MTRTFIDRSAPAFWVYVALAAYGAYRFVPLVVASGAAHPAAGATAAAAWMTYAAVLGWIVFRLELFQRRSRVTITGAFLWGALVVSGIGVSASPAMAELITGWMGQDNSGWATAMAAALVEEPLKVLGVVVLALIPGARINSALDGLFYGMFVGLGFEVAESYLYTMGAVAAQGGAIEVVAAMLLLRGVIGGLWSHPSYGGITGAGAGYVFGPEQSTARKWTVFAVLLFVAMALHFLFDSPIFDDALGPATLLKGLPVLVVLLVALRIARRRERAFFDHAARTEIDADLIREEELEVLLTRKGRRRAQRDARHTGGRRAERDLRNLQQAQIDLVSADLDAGSGSAEVSAAAERVRRARSGVGQAPM